MTQKLDVSAAEPISYPFFYAGLNNQKIALYGLFYKAWQERRPLVLPKIAIFNSKSRNDVTVPFEKVFLLENVKQFAKEHQLEVNNEPSSFYEELDPDEAFKIGATRIGLDASRGETALNEFICEFYRSLRPIIVETESFKKLSEGIFESGKITLTSQLRIETDWIRHSSEVLQNSVSDSEDYNPSFQRIIEKIKNTFNNDSKLIYVVCDEANLPVSKEEIRKEVYTQQGVYLFWKSDVLTPDEISSLSLLDLSIIDFEMAARSPKFVGITRSTFSIMAGIEAFARGKKPITNHYIYDIPGNMLAQRFDNGCMSSPSGATNRLFLRERLVVETPDDCFWPLSLTAHISRFGDFTSSGNSIIGVRGGPLVCGVRNDPLKLIEGFKLTLVGEAPCGVEYQALLDNGIWTNWFSTGNLAGTLGESRALLGFAVRLTGAMASRFECVCVGSFAGLDKVVDAKNGMACCGTGSAKLEAMHVVIRPTA